MGSMTKGERVEKGFVAEISWLRFNNLCSFENAAINANGNLKLHPNTSLFLLIMTAKSN